jgi:hypothetical protein
MLFSDFPFNGGSCLRFFLIESLKYRQLTYSVSAKVDGLFSPSYITDFCLPPSYPSKRFHEILEHLISSILSSPKDV